MWKRKLKLNQVLFWALGLLWSGAGAVFAAPPILTLNDTNAPPLTNRSRNGAINIIATEVFRRAGVDIKLIKMPAERGLQFANGGRIDGELTRIEGMEKNYPNLIPVPEKLVVWEFAAFSQHSGIPANWSEIRKRKSSYIRGWKIYERQLAGVNNVIVANDVSQLFQLLQSRRIDIALYTRNMGVTYLHTHGIEHIDVLAPVLFNVDMYIYLHKRHAALVPKIANALRALKQEGTYEKLLKYK